MCFGNIIHKKRFLSTFSHFFADLVGSNFAFIIVRTFDIKLFNKVVFSSINIILFTFIIFKAAFRDRLQLAPIGCSPSSRYCCCWLPDPFRGMGAWRKTMEPQKPGNSPRPGPEIKKRQRVAKERAAQRVRSWTVQNEMSGVLGRVSAVTAGKILDSANPEEITA